MMLIARAAALVKQRVCKEEECGSGTQEHQGSPSARGAIRTRKREAAFSQGRTAQEASKCTAVPHPLLVSSLLTCIQCKQSRASFMYGCEGTKLTLFPKLPASASS